MHAKARALLDRLDFPLKPEMRVAYLSRAEQQMVEIAKAFRPSFPCWSWTSRRRL